MASFARLMFILSALFLVVAGSIHGHEDGGSMARGLLAPGRRPLGLIVAVALALWLLTRRTAVLSLGLITVVDAAGVVVPCLGAAWMALQGSSGEVFSALLAVSFICLGRAIMVPSQAHRTAWMTALAVLPVGVAAWVVAERRAPQHAAAFGLDAADYAHHLQIESITWCLITVAVATYASSVIYGLVREIREARRLGQYTLDRKLGEGGMGQVYLAHHAMLRRPTAIKLITHDGIDQKRLAQFEKEVQHTSELSHPNTISIYDYGRTPDGVFYYAMEYLEGLDLDELVVSYGPQTPGRAIHMLAQACSALIEAHGVGLIHRDIKPANLFLCQRGGEPDVVKVVDFGLVKEVAPAEGTGAQENVIVGTPLFMSPESIHSPGEVDAQSDIYALGCVAYFLLTAEPVFSGDSIVEICGHHLHTVPSPPSERLGKALPADLERLVLACLQKEPAKRPRGAQSLRDALLACASAGSWSATQATAWWQDHVSHSAPTSEVIDVRAATVAVDLGGRLEGAG